MLPAMLLAAVCTLQFEAPRAYDALSDWATIDVQTADLDGDGFPDVVADDQLSYLRWGGPDGLGELVTLPGADAMAADLNRDERPDLILKYVSSEGPRIGVMMNLGERRFGERREVFPGTGQLLAGDFTGDLATDILVLRASDQPAFLLNDGFGNFDLKWGAAPALVSVDEAVTGDFNRDGHLDVAAAHGNDRSLRLFLGDGKGFLAPQPVLRPGTVPFAAADFDRDGADDVVSSGPTATDVMIWHGDGASVIPVGGPSGVSDAIAADFDGDGAPDLAVATHDTVHLLLNDGQGVLARRRSFVPASGGRLLATADFNRDGHQDLVIPSGYGIAILHGHGDGTFRTLPSRPPTTDLPADVDGDGIDEWIGATSNALVVTRGSRVVETISAEPWRQLAILQWDAASRRLLAVRDRVLVVFARDAAGVWRLEREIDALVAHATLGDFTGDGKLDVAYVPLATPVREVVVAPADGTPIVIPVDPSAYHYVTAADMNGDGIQDLVVTHSGLYSNIPHFFDPQPNGFISVHFLTGSPRPRRLIALSAEALLEPRRGDFNGDGTGDLAVSNYAGAVLVVLGRTAETVTRLTAIPAFDYLWPMELAVGDLNDDGYDDLVATQDEAEVHVLMGTPSGPSRAALVAQPAAHTAPVIARLERGLPRAILLRTLAEEFVLQPTCAPARRRGVRK